MTFYVYTYIDPETALPFYVGKGRGRRAWKHFHQTHSRPMADKLASMRTAGIEPEIRIDPCADEDAALAYEAELIARYGRRADGGFLFNVLPAGEQSTGFKGRHHTPETKARLSAKFKGRKMPPEHGQAISAARKGKPVNMPASTIEKMKATLRTPENRAKMAERIRAITKPDHMAQMTEKARRAVTGKKQNPEHVAKRMEAGRLTRERKRAQTGDA